MPTAVLWFRRDLRLGDHPALLAAAAAGEVLPLFVLDDRLRGPSGAPRLAFLYGCLRDLEAATGGRLVVLAGDPGQVVPRAAREAGATAVHVTADYGPYGARRDAAVESALRADGIPLVRTGSPYAVAPGVLTTAGGTPFRVYSPYLRAWTAHGTRPPADSSGVAAFSTGGPRSDGIPEAPDLAGAVLPPAGETVARGRFDAFLADGVGGYGRRRDRPDEAGTSRLSAYLKYGCVHPRSLLAAVAGRDGEGEQRFRGELAWRDFYADVLWHRPDSAREHLRPEFGRLPVDAGPTADERFSAWAQGRTGFPLVDAGMRQLLREAWMHNRVRMVAASFLVKDLHLDWRRGARHFMRQLVDGDLASNYQGWQWVAGSGTDPAPFFRVFNPVAQAEKFDPDGAYVRRYVEELRGVDAAHVHAPWTLPGGPPQGDPAPIVDHAAERREALDRYAHVTGG